MIQNSPRWVSKVEAARHLGRSVRTLETYISKGIVPAYRVHGNKVIVNMNDLDALIVERETPQLIATA